MTPNDIEVLLHCYYSPEPHPRVDSTAVLESLRSMKQNGLIEPRDTDVYHTTDRGAAHVKQLCSLAWPVQVWVNDKGEVIETT